MEDPDYYSVLCIERGAVHDEVKKAYRRLALKWHPDKNPNNKEEAEYRFKLIAEAYDVLSDPVKRKTYDQYGKAGLINGRGQSQDTFPDDFDPFTMYAPFQFHFRDPMDIFREVFGGTGLESLFGPSLFMGMENFHAPGRTHRSTTHRSAGRHNGSPYHHSSQAGRSNQVYGYAPHSQVAIPTENSFMGSIFDSFFGGSMLQRQNFFGGPGFGNSMSTSSSSMFGSFGGGSQGGFRSVSTSSRTVNGQTVRVTKICENGQETITEEVDGRVTSRTTRPHGGGALQAM